MMCKKCTWVKKERIMNNNAFTLIELLVVMAIIGTLTAIILPIVYIGQEAADQAATNAVAAKVERGLDVAAAQLRTEFNTCWKETDAPQSWGNHLYYRLSTSPTEAEIVAFKTELEDRRTNIKTLYTDTLLDIDAYRGGIGTAWSTKKTDYYNGVIAQMKKREAHIFRAEKYTADILDRNDIGSDFIKEHTDERGVTFEGVCDAYGSLLIHVNKYEPGIPVKRYCSNAGSQYPLPYTKFQKSGRSIIEDLNANGIEDEVALSDIRKTCYNGYEYAHEIWSAGPDLLFDPIRGNILENDDNFTHAVDQYRGEQ